MKHDHPNLFRVSAAANLALHAALLLARYDDRPARTRELAGTLGASEAHLAKVLRQLERHGLVRGTRGPSGGFRLARPAAAVTLLEVYEAVEGRAGNGRCIFGIATCDGRVCSLGGYFRKVNREVLARLANTRLSDVGIRIGVKRGKAQEDNQD